jgi:hypothetical protein
VPLLQACHYNTTQKFSGWRYPRNERGRHERVHPKGLAQHRGLAPFDLKRLSIVPPFAIACHAIWRQMWDRPPHYFQVALSAVRQLSLVPNVKSACSDIAKGEIVLAISRLAELDIHSRGA